MSPRPLLKPKRAYHQSSRELRDWVVDYALLRPTRTQRRWLEENKRKGANRGMLAMCSFPLCERSATLLAEQASRLPRLPYSPSSSERPSGAGPARTREDLLQHMGPCVGTRRCWICVVAPRSVSWGLHACAEVEKHQYHYESLAPPL